MKETSNYSCMNSIDNELLMKEIQKNKPSYHMIYTLFLNAYDSLAILMRQLLSLQWLLTLAKVVLSVN